MKLQPLIEKHDELEEKITAIWERCNKRLCDFTDEDMVQWQFLLNQRNDVRVDLRRALGL